MTISRDHLRAMSPAYSTQRVTSLNEAKRHRMKTAFLCHSHKDAEFVRGFIALLKQAHVEIYVDWQDAELPPTPDRATAQRIQERIVGTQYFMFLATPNSIQSRWCPWEIGYANGIKNIDSILVIPTTSSSNDTTGNEYLELYRRVDVHGASLLFYEPSRYLGTPLSNL